ncbi:MAG: hypothetical protein QOI54_991 [Actinomycetota bacterium]|jgi:hypothetical protein|nr:hypothetical protein [Actinomycetota bacterium]
MSERDIEAPDEDAAEQAAAVDLDLDDELGPQGATDHEQGSIELDPADRAEQEREVPLGDDEYR